MARKRETDETRRLKARLLEDDVDDIEYEDIDDGDEDIDDSDTEKETEIEFLKEEKPNAKFTKQSNFNPLAGSPKSADREYTKGNTDNNIDEVDEAYIKPNVIEEDDDDNEIDEKEEPKSVNPDVKNLSSDEKRIASENAFDIAVQGYKMLFELSRKGVRIKDSKINQLVRKGEVNLYVPISVTTEDNKVVLMPFKDVIEIFNKNVDNELVYSQDFIDNIREPVIHKFMENGIGLTNDNMIWYLVIMELARMGLAVYGLHTLKTSFINDAKDNFEDMKKQNIAQQQQQQQQAPPQQTQQDPINVVEVKEEDIEVVSKNDAPIRETEENLEKGIDVISENKT